MRVHWQVLLLIKKRTGAMWMLMWMWMTTTKGEVHAHHEDVSVSIPQEAQVHKMNLEHAIGKTKPRKKKAHQQQHHYYYWW